MTASTTLLAELAASQYRDEDRSVSHSTGSLQLNIALLSDFIHSVTEHILNDDLPREEEIWLIDLLDALKTEQEAVQARLASPKEDPLLGWHLHLRSQSGFDLQSE